MVAQLHGVLDQEKALLISAQFAQLGDIVSQKERLLRQLDAAPPPPALLLPIRDKMAENQALLAAAIKGVAAAGERLKALQKVQESLSVYDPSGRVELARKHQRNLEKKA